MKNEGDVKKEVKRLLNKHDWFWWMTPANGFGSSGTSDFCAIKDGVFMVIETKFGKGKLTAMQRAYLDSVNAASCFGFVVNEDSLPWLESFLEDFGQQTILAMKEQKLDNVVGARMVDAIRNLQILI
jgi:Holliday junction resolvase